MIIIFCDSWEYWTNPMCWFFADPATDWVALLDPDI